MQRENANGVDVTSTGDICGIPGTPAPSSQPGKPLLCVRQFSNHQFTVHTSYHGGTEYLSYPWSYRPRLHPINRILITLLNFTHSSSGYEIYPTDKAIRECIPSTEVPKITIMPLWVPSPGRAKFPTISNRLHHKYQCTGITTVQPCSR